MTKKILMLYDFFSEHGGVERIMSFQARTLKKAGYDVSFAFAYVDDELRKKRLPSFKVFEYAKLPVKNETFQICSSIFKVTSFEKFKKFDLIICHSFPASYLALRLKKRYNIPYVLHLHHPPQFLYSADLDWAKSSFKRKFSFILGKIFRKPLKKFDFYCVKNADFYFIECKSVQRLLHGIKFFL
jgi:glycosyltransferase involved in cell wall biosynthesis